MKSLFVPLSLSALSVLGLLGCSNSTESPGSTVWKNSGIGSVYTFDVTSHSDVSDDPTALHDTRTSASLIAFSTGEKIGEKLNCSRFGAANSGGLTIAYEPNGDFSVGDSNSQGWHWSRYPSSTHIPNPDPSIDSVDDFGARHIYTGTRTFDGQQSVVLGGRSYLASKVVEYTTSFDSSESSVYSDHYRVSIWWIPELKLFGQFDTEDSAASNASGHLSVFHSATSAKLVMYGERQSQTGASAIQ